ncbi:hypothetical protein [Cytobacillus oceanisediminis]|uniref:hypothetical protein n=1 Tax=Cytobacillus oceanisediminis TaxID=665099 RepID=UPI00139069DF|nr:hypothetical protein [Cytobacillus oceanisediminis]
MQELHAYVKDSHETLNRFQSVLDKQLAQAYHDIERSGEFDMAEGNKHAKKLKEILTNRRLVKDELARLQPVYNFLRHEVEKTSEQYQRAVRRSYELRQELNVTEDLGRVYAAFGVE